MNDKKENTGFWQSWMTIVILAAFTIMVFIFNSQSPSIRPEIDNSILAENNVPIHNSIGITDNSTNATDNDTNFKNWITMSFAIINEDLNCISKAGQKRNFTDTEICGRLLKENSDISLQHINEYNISMSLQTLSEEYKKALEDYYIGGMNLETGARNRDMSQMDDAIKYIQSGNARIEIIDSMLYKDGYGNVSNTTSM